MGVLNSDPVTIKSGTKEAEKAGEFHFTRHSQSERTRNAATILGLMWVCALGAVFIPIAHFFLVPGFLIAGPVLAIQRYRKEISANHISGTCPSCASPITIALDASDTIPLWKNCPQTACSKPLGIFPAAAEKMQSG